MPNKRVPPLAKIWKNSDTPRLLATRKRGVVEMRVYQKYVQKTRSISRKLFRKENQTRYIFPVVIHRVYFRGDRPAEAAITINVGQTLEALVMG